MFQYRLSGLDNIYLHGGVTRIGCRGCGESYTLIEAEQQLTSVIALGLLLRPAILSGSEMRFLRKTCQLSQIELAGKLGITRRAVLEREKRPNPGLRADQELGLRAILFAAFKSRQERGGANLDPKHAEMLEQAIRNFVRFAETLKRRSRKRRATITRDPRRKRWRLAESETRAA
jgi:transcriptional regulator with XRE-family HTH domain